MSVAEAECAKSLRQRLMQEQEPSGLRQSLEQVGQAGPLKGLDCMDMTHSKVMVSVFSGEMREEGEVEGYVSWRDIEKEISALILTGEYQPEKPRLDEIQSDGMREDDEIIDADFREVDDEEQEEELDEFAIPDEPESYASARKSLEEAYAEERELTPEEAAMEDRFVTMAEYGAEMEAEAEHVTFAYDNEVILDNYSLKLQPGKITGIHGASGSGKSTLLKLLMRFWDVQDGSVSVDGTDVRKIPTKHLRDMESYVTQETHLFHDSIANNIAIAKPGASREEIMEAAKKASIHDFIMTLPKGYDTEVGELGDTLSGGEKQRIGIARAFLHECPLILLDEPTSNLDSLNEGIILKSLKESAKKKTVVLVSHRVSTMNVADVVYEMENGRIS